jgi:hypothetical protein
LAGETLSFVLEVTDSDGLIAKADTVVNVRNVNQPPVSDAGPDLKVPEGSVVVLHGSGADPDDDTVTYSWRQTFGPPVILADPDGADTTFRSPEGGGEGVELVFELTVTDAGGLKSEDLVNLQIVPHPSSSTGGCFITQVATANPLPWVGGRFSFLASAIGLRLVRCCFRRRRFLARSLRPIWRTNMPDAKKNVFGEGPS